MSTNDYAIGRERGAAMSDRWERLYNKAAVERDRLKEINAGLLEALKGLAECANSPTHTNGYRQRWIDEARAAIAKAEGKARP